MKKLTLGLLALIALAGCGPFYNKYVTPTDTHNDDSVEVAYTGDFVYPQALYFKDGASCSGPKDLEIKPLGSRNVLVPSGMEATFMLGDIAPVKQGFHGLSVGICNIAFSFTPKPGTSYVLNRHRANGKCAITLVATTGDGTSQDITNMLKRRAYSVRFMGGNGPYCHD